MTTAWLSIPRQSQRQDSVQEQLDELRLVAAHLGMYDAADFLQRLRITWFGADEAAE